MKTPLIVTILSLCTISFLFLIESTSQQKLTLVRHPDHILITYPNLGHEFHPSSQWFTQAGPIPEYVLADLYSWLESRSGLAEHGVTLTPPSLPSVNLTG